MVAVFWGFESAVKDDLVQAMDHADGLRPGLAVLLDATIVRMVLVPASMKILGTMELVSASSACAGCQTSVWRWSREEAVPTIRQAGLTWHQTFNHVHRLPQFHYFDSLTGGD